MQSIDRYPPGRWHNFQPRRMDRTPPGRIRTLRSHSCNIRRRNNPRRRRRRFHSRTYRCIRHAHSGGNMPSDSLVGTRMVVPSVPRPGTGSNRRGYTIHSPYRACTIIPRHNPSGLRGGMSPRMESRGGTPRVGLGYAQWNLGHRDAARAEWQRVLLTDPHNDEARDALTAAARAQ